MASTISPTIQNISWDRTGDIPILTPINLTISESETVDYVMLSVLFENTYTQWLIGDVNSGDYVPHNGSFAQLQFSLDSINELQAGSYKAKILLDISNVNGFIRTVESEVNLTLTTNPPNSIKTDQDNYNVLYQRDTDTFSGETLVTILNNTNADTLQLDTIGTLLNESTFTSSFSLEEDAAFPFATNTELPTSGVKVVNCRLKKGSDFVYYFTVTITVIESDEIVVSPESLDFELRKDFSETKNAVLAITNPLNHAFTITAPDWLNLSATSGSASTNITVTTDNSSTLSVGNLSGNITISYDSRQVVIPVTAVVKEFISINLSAHNFCLDKIILTAKKMIADAFYLRLKFTMLFETKSGQITKTSEYTIPYFNGEISTDIGEKVQNFFPVFKEHLFQTTALQFNNQLVYKPAKVDITVEELDRDYTVVFTKDLDTIDLFAGNKPKLFPLFTNHFFRRKFAGFQYIFSYFTGLESGSDFGTSPGNAQTSNDVQTVLFTSDSLLDYATIKTKYNLEFIDFPNPERIIVSQFLNNNLVPESFIFTGKYQLPVEFENIMDDFEENAEKFSTREKLRFTINTGWILKEEKELLREMAKSKLVYINLDGKILKTHCLSTKLILEDTENFMYQYELEFKIIQ